MSPHENSKKRAEEQSPLQARERIIITRRSGSRSGIAIARDWSVIILLILVSKWFGLWWVTIVCQHRAPADARTSTARSRTPGRTCSNPTCSEPERRSRHTSTSVFVAGQAAGVRASPIVQVVRALLTTACSVTFRLGKRGPTAVVSAPGLNRLFGEILARSLALHFSLHFSGDVLYAAPVCAVTPRRLRREVAHSSVHAVD